MTRLRIRTEVDSRPPFDGERYWRWKVYREVTDATRIDYGITVFAMGWTRTKRAALQVAHVVRREIRCDAMLYALGDADACR